MKAELKDARLSGVCEVIAAHMGLYFPTEKWDLLNRNLVLAAKEFGFIDYDEFIHWLLITPLKKNHIEMLACYLTIPETYFWRETKVFSALTDFILPELIDSKQDGEKSIRIWSAGCSTGEEPYSLAIALYKTIPNIKDWKIVIMATDINPAALDKAKTGIYSQWSFRNCPARFKSNYFLNLGDGKYEILPEIKDLVTFSNLNLTDEISASNVNKALGMDIIFCRNVMMYFTEEWRSKISRNFYNSLTKNGWFVVSSCELSSQLFPDFLPVNFPGAVMYRKGKKESTSSKKVPLNSFVPDSYFPLVTALPVIAEASFHNSALDSDIVPFTFSEFVNTKVKNPNIDNGLKIRLLANKGCLTEALLLCDEGIAGNKFSITLYFLRASILQELNRTKEAITSLKRAIYLDPNFIIGHFTLGNLYIKQGKQKNANKYFDNVLDLLSTYSNDDILPESEGLPVKYIREIILSYMPKNSML